MKTELVKRLESFRRNLNSSSGWGGTPFQFTGRSCNGRWMESPEDHFRFTGLAHDIVSLRHKGWYTDDNQDETARGVVYQMTAKDGETRFIAAIADPCNAGKDGAGPCVVEVKANGMPHIYDDKEEAARNADQFAEWYAEGAREDNARQMAEMQIEDKGREIVQLRDEVRNLLGEMRGEQRETRPNICAALWQTNKCHRQEMHSLYKRIATLKDNYSSCVDSPPHADVVPAKKMTWNKALWDYLFFLNSLSSFTPSQERHHAFLMGQIS